MVGKIFGNTNNTEIVIMKITDVNEAFLGVINGFGIEF